MIPLWTIGAGIGLVSATVAGVGAWTVRGWQCEAAEADRLRQAAKDMEAAAKKMNEASTSYEQERAEAPGWQQEQQTAIRTVYRNKVVPGNCAADAGAVRVLRQSVQRANSRASGELGSPVPEPSPPTRATN